MHIYTITLQSLLPLVFRGMEDSASICASEVWKVNSLTLQRGCRLCVQAESGSGKSSLLSFIYGNRNDYCGNILFNGRDIRQFSIVDWCRLRTENLALLPQEMRLFPELTVQQNIEIKNRRTATKSAEQIDALLSRLGILDKRNTLVGRLSIGQQQRVAIVRAVCQPFDFIFMDEPVSHLDTHNNEIVADIIDEEARRQDAGVITTSVGNPLMLKNAQFINL